MPLPVLLLHQLGQIRCLGIVDLQELGEQRFKFADILAGFEVGLFTCGDLVCRRNDDYAAVLAHVQPLGGEDDVEGLVPGYVLQTQGDIAGHAVGHDDVPAADISQQLQDGAGLDILEGQREPLARVLTIRTEQGRLGVFLRNDHRCDFDE